MVLHEYSLENLTTRARAARSCGNFEVWKTDFASIGTDRAQYVEAFFANVAWPVVDRRLSGETGAR